MRRIRNERSDSGPLPKRNRVDSDCVVVNYDDLPTNDLESPGDGDLSNNLESPDTNPDLLLNTVHTSNTTSQTKRLEYPEQYFKFHKCGIKPGNSLYQCMVGDCPSKQKILSTTDNSRGNLRKHIKKCHGNSLEEFSRPFKEIDTKSSGKPVSATAPPHKDPTQLKLSFEGYPRSLTQALLDSYVVDYICDAVLPVYHTERKDFRKFINRLCPKLRVRSRSFYRNLISKAYIAKNRELLLQLPQARYICKTADCWSTRRKSFLGVTVHWIDNDLKRVSACLAIRRVIGQCNYEVLAKLLEAIHEEFDITAKITATVTDNGSNFVKAFRLFATPFGHETSSNILSSQLEDPIPTNGETQNSDISDTDSEFEEDQHQEESEAEKEIREMEDQAIEEFLEITTILDKRVSDVIYSLPPQRRCASHTLNLIATKDVYNQIDASLKNLKESTESKMKQIWNKQSQSSKASDEIVKRLKGLFVIHNETRWNAFFDAVDRFLIFINTKKSDLKDVFAHFNVPYFRPAEEDYIREYIKIMRPLIEALDVLQADKKVSIGYLLPTLTILMNKMVSLRRKTGIVHCKAFIASIISSLKVRFGHCFDDEELCLAAMVHPKFKLSWIKDSERTAMLENLNLSFESFSTDSIPSSYRTVVSEDSDTSPNKKKNFFESLSRTSSIPSTSELDMFLADQSTKTSSLLKYPTIKEMFLKLNAALPSSASVERLFSVGGSIFRPTRNRLSDANFEKMLFLKVNSKL